MSFIGFLFSSERHVDGFCIHLLPPRDDYLFDIAKQCTFFEFLAVGDFQLRYKISGAEFQLIPRCLAGNGVGLVLALLAAFKWGLVNVTKIYIGGKTQLA